MNKNYKININSKPLTDEVISKHKDFDALLRQFEEQKAAPAVVRPMRRWLYYVSGAAAAAIIGFLLFVNYDTFVETGPTPEAFFAEQPFINPPFKNVQAKFVKNDVNAAKGASLKFDKSKLNVPPGAFRDESGNIVDGNVDIKYREFHDYVDFFLSGIPMHYDSAGVRYQLESAGMIEIYAEKDGQRLDLNPDNPIEIELISSIRVREGQAIPKYNIYKLDINERNWQYKGIDDIELLEDGNKKRRDNNSPQQRLLNQYERQLGAINQEEQAAIAALEATIPLPAQPQAPEKASKDKLTFELDIDLNEIEFRNAVDASDEDNDVAQLRKYYENIIWQEAPGGAVINDKFNLVAWEDVKIKQIAKHDYEITFIAGNTEKKVIANPVLAGDDYRRAQADYQNELDAYNQLLADREARLRDQKEEIANRFASAKASARQTYKTNLANLSSGSNNVAPTFVEHKIVNRFKATSFGIWNCDRPIPPQFAKVKASFRDKAEKEYNHNIAYMVDKNRNTVKQYYTKKGNALSYDNDSENLLWLVTEDDKIAIFRPNDFDTINQKKGDHTFVMKVIDKEIKAEEDVRKILGFESKEI